MSIAEENMRHNFEHAQVELDTALHFMFTYIFEIK